MPHDNDNKPPATCRRCAADWRGGAYSPDCAECGGGAMVRLCPACGGACGAVWRRLVIDSNDSGEAHWAGHCALTDDSAATDPVASAGRIEWWLDGSARPDLYWALLVDHPAGGVLVRDMDGADRAFAAYADAVAWLREDEYEKLDDLWAAEGFIPVAPPPVAWLGKRVAAKA